ncbi:MAG: SdpI family protein [Bacillota bacterium]|nr:SdpI family protein [Bacillota bacterium]
MDLFFNSLTGLVLIGIGLFGVRSDPRNMNSRLCYKSRSAMRNKDTWLEANRYSSLIMIMGGIAAIIIGIIAYLVPGIPANIKGQVCTVLAIITFISTFPLTELHLKKVFNDRGKRRSA